MQDSDKKEFSDAMDAVGASYGTDMSTAVKKLWWRLLADKIEFLALQTALDRHMLDPDRGRFMPKPADIIAIVEKAHHRLSADEAWAIALESFDESATVCVTEEMLEALGAAQAVWEYGDKVGARMAFKGAYERITSERRNQGIAPQWQLSLGWDADKRTYAAQEALRLGRMTRDDVQEFLPAPAPTGIGAQIAGLLAGKTNVLAFPSDQDAKNRRRMQELREHLAAQPGPQKLAAPPPVKRDLIGESELDAKIRAELAAQSISI